MILTCPECEARFLAKIDDIGHQGRMVRCSSCSATWFAKPDADILTLSEAETLQAQSGRKPGHNGSFHSDQPSSSISADLADMPYSEGLQAASALRDRSLKKRAAKRWMIVSSLWGITLGLIALMALGLFMARDQIVTRYPAAATLYDAFGISAAKDGLRLKHVTTDSLYLEGQLALIIQGEIDNSLSHDQTVPRLYFTLLDESEDKLADWEWEAELPDQILGRSVYNFTSQYDNPPINAVKLYYGLAPYRRQFGALPATNQPIDQATDKNEGHILGLDPVEPLLPERP